VRFLLRIFLPCRIHRFEEWRIVVLDAGYAKVGGRYYEADIACVERRCLRCGKRETAKTTWKVNEPKEATR